MESRSSPPPILFRSSRDEQKERESALSYLSMPAILCSPRRARREVKASRVRTCPSRARSREKRRARKKRGPSDAAAATKERETAKTKFVLPTLPLFRLGGEMQLDAAAAAAAGAAVAPAPLQRQGDKPSTELLPPVAVHIVDGHGYVWDADGENAGNKRNPGLAFSFFSVSFFPLSSLSLNPSSSHSSSATN